MTQHTPNNHLWVEKYRPQNISECILPDSIKTTFQDMVESGEPQNLLLSGGAGVGKTTIARALCNELGCNSIIINCSENGIIQPIHSRCTNIEFGIPSAEKPQLASEFLDRIKTILDREQVEYDEKVLVRLILKYFPDFRRVLNELQRYSVSGTIDVGILSQIGEVNVKDLMGCMKKKDFSGVRKWVVANIDNDQTELFRKIYDSMYDYISADSIPLVILILADYQHKAAFVADAEINMTACLVQIMMEANFK